MSEWNTNREEPTNAEIPPDTSGSDPQTNHSSRVNHNSLGQVVGRAKHLASQAQNYYEHTISPAVERSGAKDFYQNKVASPSKEAAQLVRQRATDQRARFTATPVSRISIGLLIVSVAVIICTFLPMGPTSVGRYLSAARNVVDGNFEGVSGLVLVQVLGVLTSIVAATILRLLLLVTSVASVVAIALRSGRANKIAGLSGTITGLLGTLVALISLLVSTSLENMPLGIGTILLLIASLALAIVAVFVWRTSKAFAIPTHALEG